MNFGVSKILQAGSNLKKKKTNKANFPNFYIFFVIDFLIFLRVIVFVSFFFCLADLDFGLNVFLPERSITTKFMSLYVNNTTNKRPFFKIL
jgi:hypothetical protein